jgi:hypothetical protein
MRALVPVSLLAALAIAPAAQPLAAAPADPCRQAAVSKRLGTMVAGLNGGRGDRFAAGFTPTGRWQPYTRTVAPPGVVGRRRITQLATISIGAEAEWHLSALRRVGAGRYTIRVAVEANDHPWGRGRTTLAVDCRTGLVRSWIGPATRHPLPVDDD